MNTHSKYSRLDLLLTKVVASNPTLEGELHGLAAKLLDIKDVIKRARGMSAFLDLLEALTD